MTEYYDGGWSETARVRKTTDARDIDPSTEAGYRQLHATRAEDVPVMQRRIANSLASITGVDTRSDSSVDADLANMSASVLARSAPLIANSEVTGWYFGTEAFCDAFALLSADAFEVIPPSAPDQASCIHLARPILLHMPDRIIEAHWIFWIEAIRGMPAFYAVLDPSMGFGMFTESVKDGGSILAELRLVRWVLGNPDLMEKRVIDTAKPTSRAAIRRGKVHKPSPVTIVDLRAAHKKAAADVERAERTYAHRWIVRGHWHHFWTGPRNGERKLEARYVMPYVKGPDGAPLNVTEKVSVW